MSALRPKVLPYANCKEKTLSYVPTLLDYPGVSQIRHRCPALAYGSPNLTDKIMCYSVFSLKFISFFLRILLIHRTASGAFLHVFDWQRLFCHLQYWKQILMVCNSCQTSHNFLSHSHVIIWVLRRTGSIYGGGGGGVRWHSGGLCQRESLPIFNRSPEVGISAFFISTLRNNTWQFILFICPVWNSWISIYWWALWVYTSGTSNNMNFIPFYFTIKIGETAGLWIFWVFPAKIQSL